MTLFLVSLAAVGGLCGLFTYALCRAEIRAQNIERMLNETQEEYVNREVQQDG